MKYIHILFILYLCNHYFHNRAPYIIVYNRVPHWNPKYWNMIPVIVWFSQLWSLNCGAWTWRINTWQKKVCNVTCIIVLLPPAIRPQRDCFFDMTWMCRQIEFFRTFWYIIRSEIKLFPDWTLDDTTTNSKDFFL